MSENPDQIRKHIEVLTDFEQKYGGYIRALEADWSAGVAAEAGVEEPGAGWSSEEWTRRKRQLQMDAVRADQAIEASGVGGLVFTEPPALRGGIRSADLPSQIFDFIEVGYFGQDDGMSFQRKLLERMPSQIAGLEVRLEEAEAAETGKPPRRDRTRPRRRPIRTDRLVWINHPWTITVAGTVIGGVILAAILGLFH